MVAALGFALPQSVVMAQRLQNGVINAVLDIMRFSQRRNSDELEWELWLYFNPVASPRWKGRMF